ncbi:MAG: polyprenyl synthetase family protein, partial [Bryobacteraceae bacterium]|nr:polyprenyl synthetase family protein [Bryobacteraceae bacterium]
MSLAIAIPSPSARGFALSHDRVAVETELSALVSPPGTSRTPFRDAMHYAALGSGQRLRPILSLRTARALGIESALTLRAAAAVELIHCASLIVDDLPCMDNEAERRGRPTTHTVYGEPTALLAAFGLVGLAGRCLLTMNHDPSACATILHFQSHLLGSLDASGLCEGQDLDLRLQGTDRALLRS